MPLPNRLKSIFWSADTDRLDAEKHKTFIIHNTLVYGTFEEIRRLFSLYPKNVIIDVFTNKPSKIYPKEVFYFIKNYILPLRETELDEENYITSISGPVRQRAARNQSISLIRNR